MSKSESDYSGPDRRKGDNLSGARALEIMNALELARDTLESKRENVKGRLVRWFADLLDVNYIDVDVPCKFRKSDTVAGIRELFVDSSNLNEAAVLAGGWEDCEEEVRDEFLEARAKVLADFAEIMVRSGIASKPREVNQNEDIVFTGGHIYRIEIQGKKILATCSGFTENGKHFHQGHPFCSGEPIFQFNRGKEFNSYGRYVGGYKIGKEYMLQEPKHDVYMEFCGYTRNGEPVMKFLRRKSIEEVGKKADGGFSAGISS